MSDRITAFSENVTKQGNPDINLIGSKDGQGRADSAALPVFITKSASKQTYFTIRFLADRDRVLDAYRAYAYFRWVDDWIDGESAPKAERVAFLERQQALVNACYEGKYTRITCDEENMLIDLIHQDSEPHSGLQAYIRNMMAVMAFDVNRRHRLISQEELARYTCCLSTAVTEALHFFIGHHQHIPYSETRYLAVAGAHIIHMLRDTVEDIAAGYFNIPCEFLSAHGISVCEIQRPAFRGWVRSRVELAKKYLKVGKAYLDQSPNFRFRLAGYAYIARFEVILNAIEKEDYILRAHYNDRKSLRGTLRMSKSILAMLLARHAGGAS